jgi:hypothetical protein
MLPTVARTLGSLYQVALELLRRVQCGIEGKYHYLRERNAIWKFSDHISYVVCLESVFNTRE